MDRSKSNAVEWIEERRERFTDIAQRIWEHPELAMEEHFSAALLADELEQEGFTMERGVAEMPTAFVASWGSGSPTIGIMCEYDALPGLSNEAVPERKPIVEGGPGHGCGHNLIGTGSMAAAMAVRSVLEKEKLPGTVKLFGTPAEETLAGKVFMTRDKVFEGLDAALTWHPYGKNRATYESSLALLSVRFAFEGKTCHIPSRPEAGRNALDAADLMNVAANMRRKHFPPGTTMEYVLLEGGNYPNVIPDLAEVWYFIRSPEVNRLEEVFRDVQNAARGAALATRTKVKMKMVSGCYGYLPNKSLTRVAFENFQLVGAPRFTQEEKALAHALQRTLDIEMEEPLDEGIEFHGDEVGLFSQDDGDLSWLCPLTRIRTSAWVDGVPSHTWQTTVSCGTSIGYKGMMVAAEAMTLTALDLYTRPEALKAAKEEFDARTRGFEYRCLIPPDVKPIGDPPSMPLSS